MANKVTIKKTKADSWDIIRNVKNETSLREAAWVINRVIDRGISPYTLNVLHEMPKKSMLIGTNDLSYLWIPIKIELKEISGHTAAEDLLKNPELGIGLVYEMVIKNKKTDKIYWTHTFDYSKMSLYNIFVDVNCDMPLGDFVKNVEFTEADIIKYIYRAICRNMRYLDKKPIITALNKNNICITVKLCESMIRDYSFKCIFDDDFYLEDDDDDDD